MAEINTKVSVPADADLKSLIKEGLEKALETNDKYAKKFHLTNSVVDETKAKKAEGIKKSMEFVRAIVTGDSAKVREISGERAKAINEGAVADGGALVPTEFERSVMLALDDFSEVRKYALVLPMGSNTKNLNALTGKVSVHKKAELSNITASMPTFAEPVLTAEMYVGATVISEEELEDAEVEVINMLSKVFAERFAQAEQDSFINSAVSGSEGLLQVSGTTGTSIITGTTFSALQWDDLAVLQKLVFASSKSEARNMQFLMGMTAYNALRTLKASSGGTYFVTPAVPTQDAPATAWGRPILVFSEMPETTATATKFVVGTDLSQHFVIGDRRGIRMQVQTQGTVDGVNLNTALASALVLSKRTAQVVVRPAGVATLATN